MPHNPHDTLFKRVFSQVEHAAGELRAVLPAPLVAAIDFDSLRLEPGSFVDEELAERHTDLLYSAQLRGREALLYLVFEHQSTVDALMVFRLLRYVCRIWERWLAENPSATTVPAVIPVVLYHGASRWTAATRLHELVDLPEELLAVVGKHVPDVELVLDDLNAVDGAELLARALTADARLALWCLLISHAGELDAAALALGRRAIRDVVAAPDAPTALATALRYLWDVLGEEREVIIDVLLEEEVGSAAKENHVGTIAEKYRRQGREQGREDERRSLLLRLLALKFGPLSAGAEARVHDATPAELDRWVERILVATRIEDVWE